MTTIRDVARESGVSIATVSYVLNDGPRPVRAATRQRVLKAMHRLNYHPNAVARALASGRAETLGVVFGSVEPAIVTNPYVVGVLQGIMTAAAAAGYGVTLFPWPWINADKSAWRVNDGRCDGLAVVAPLNNTDMVESLSALGLPLVVVSAATPEASGIPFVDVDNALGIRLGTEHLLALGHRRIAHIMGDETQRSVHERRASFIATMRAHGLGPPSEYLASCSYNARRCVEEATRLLALRERPTAFVAGNDTLALTAIRTAQELGVRVPQELSIVGFDDIPTSALVTPALTTVRQPLAEIGERAASLLLARIEGVETTNSSSRARPELVVRNSTAPPTASRFPAC